MTRLRVVFPWCLLVALSACRPDATPMGPVEPTAETPAAGASAATPRTDDGMLRQTASGSPDTPSPMPDPREAAERRDMLAMADTVARHGDAQALVLAALIRTSALPSSETEDADTPSAPTPMDGTVRDWLDGARRQAPDDVVALIVAINLERFDQTRRQSLIARWRVLEPDNLVPILLAGLPETEMFDAAAAAQAYDGHYDDFLRTMYDTLSRTVPAALLRTQARQAGMTLPEFLASSAIAYRTAAVSPDYPQVITPCERTPLAGPRLAQCRSVAGVLLDHGDDQIAEMVGARLLAHVAPAEAGRRQAAERLRVARWLSQQHMNVYLRDPSGSGERIARIFDGHQAFSEQSLMRQLVVESGLSPVPPTGWQPDQAH